MPTKKQKNDNQLAKIALIGVIVIIVVLIMGFSIVSISNNSNKSVKFNNSTATTSTIDYTAIPAYQALADNYTLLQSKFSSFKYNLSNPSIKTIYENKTIVIQPRQDNYIFYNSTYNLYNNYSIASDYNLSFTVPNDGYIIIKLNNISEEDYPHLRPLFGTYGISVFPISLETYLSYPSVRLCPAGYYCAPQKAEDLGWGLYPINSSSTYMAPVSRGFINITITNYNTYPLNVNFSVIYVGEHYTNMTQININYT